MSLLLQSARTAFTGLWADAVWGEWESAVLAQPPAPEFPLPAAPVPSTDAERPDGVSETRH